MDPTGAIYAAAGVAMFLAALLPRLIQRAPISLPMIFLATGIILFSWLDWLPSPDPMANGSVVEHVTEACVIISLMGAGLALDRPVGWRRWISTWRLLGITMPLTMLGVGFLGGWLLGLSAGGAVLLAAVLAPTDPVLASEVQVGEPDAVEKTEDETRFALTSEAGLNDSLAFPFTYAAIAIATVGLAPSGWLGGWLAVDVLWRLGAGILVGLGIGWALRRLFFCAPNKRFQLAERGEGFVALASTFAAYGVAELIEGYGFLAVFVCACTIRAGESANGYHKVLHSYVEQLERLFTIVILIFLGGSIARGLLADVTWTYVAVALTVLLVIRPIAGWIGLLGGRTGPHERAVIAFFGVRGIGSIYYLAYALGHANFPEGRMLWSIVGLVIALSVVIHGVAAGPVMHKLDARRQAVAQEQGDVGKASVTAV